MAAKIIDTTFFEGDLFIPQKTEASRATMLNRYIDDLEPIYFKKVLGLGFGTLVYNDIVTYGLIVNGDPVSFTGVNGEEVWEGLKKSCAEYIWYEYMKRNMITQSTSAGEKVVQAQNALDANPIEKLCMVWNHMVENHWILYRYLNVKMTTYPTFNIWYVQREVTKKINSFGI